MAPPRPLTERVARASLLARLDAGSVRPLTLIAAPAGFGKTTLVGAWVATRREPIAWVSLDADDDDPVRFWRYLITACQTFEAELGRTALVALRAAQPPSFQALLTSFINELAQLPQHCILVLDDYHVITSPEIHAALGFLLEHLPPILHLIVITRGEPPLPIARLRARNQLSELHAADLRFSPAEIQTFFQQTLQLPLSPQTLTRLEAQTEGWATGLRLIALAWEGRADRSDAEQFLAAFTGGERHIVDYLVGEVLADQPPALQDFLLSTSFLDRLTGTLCDAVTGRHDSAQLLEHLARANLFLLPLGQDNGRTWYRYYALFAEAMRHSARQRLSEAKTRAVMEKASQWYADHGFLDEAIEAALAAQDFAQAATLVEQVIDQRSFNELYTLRRWAEQIPEDVLRAHPVLCFNYAMVLLFTLDRYAPATAALLETPLRMAEDTWRSQQNDARLGQVFSLRANVHLWQGDLTRGFAYARESLELLAEDDVFWRGASLLTVGLEELLTGQIDAAHQRLIESRALCGAAQNIHGVLAAIGLLGEVCVWQGEFDQASQLYQQVLADAIGGEEMLDDQALAWFGLGAIAYERNDLEAAEQQAARALDLAVQRSNEDVQMHATVLLARVRQARSEPAQAQDLLQRLAVRIRRPLLLREALMWQARLSYANHDPAAVEHWSAIQAQGNPDVPPTLQEQEALILARLRMADQQPAAALKLLEPWRIDAHQHGRVRSEIEILSLQALAYFAQSDQEQARKWLIRVLNIAQPRGYQRVFLDEGEPMAQLLRSTLADLGKRSLQTYATILLRQFASTRPTQPVPAASTSSPLLEPLSPQEHRVLRLLAAGLSNPEIARELVVSTNTIKTQVQSIYRKLNVNTREDAADVARQLNLR